MKGFREKRTIYHSHCPPFTRGVEFSIYPGAMNNNHLWFMPWDQVRGEIELEGCSSSLSSNKLLGCAPRLTCVIKNSRLKWVVVKLDSNEVVGFVCLFSVCNWP